MTQAIVLATVEVVEAAVQVMRETGGAAKDTAAVLSQHESKNR